LFSRKKQVFEVTGKIPCQIRSAPGIFLFHPTGILRFKDKGIFPVTIPVLSDYGVCSFVVRKERHKNN
jgi:hypothetical protein